MAERREGERQSLTLFVVAGAQAEDGEELDDPADALADVTEVDTAHQLQARLGQDDEEVVAQQDAPPVTITAGCPTCNSNSRMPHL